MAQGFLLGALLGPAGAVLAYLFSAQHNRAARSFAALRGMVATSLLIIAVLSVVLIATVVF